MKQTVHIINIVSAILLIGVLPSSCIYDDEEYPGQPTDTIRVNTQSVNGSRTSKYTEGGDNTFMLLFWSGTKVTTEDNKTTYFVPSHLEPPADGSKWPADNTVWPTPYFAGHAPQHVDFYRGGTYDTRYSYPDADTYLYVTGYSPGNLLTPELTPESEKNYLRIKASLKSDEIARYDFLGCDVWGDVFRGKRSDPFAQDKNRIYFRHLAAKLVVYADRDEATMENKQFVRHVVVTNLYMDIGDGTGWQAMHTPSVFEWQKLNQPDDFPAAYENTCQSVLLIKNSKNESIYSGISINSRPSAGYKAIQSVTFSGDDDSFELQKRATDRVPIDGMVIDSCYVCNPIENGKAKVNQPIQLKMDISAEMSFDHNFPMGDGDNPWESSTGSTTGSTTDPTTGSTTSSTTDDLTFTRKVWQGVTATIYEVDDKGVLPATDKTPVTEFKPGHEYRIYLHFFRSGINVVAEETPWNYGGVHYISIQGGDQQQTTDKNQDAK